MAIVTTETPFAGAYFAPGYFAPAYWGVVLQGPFLTDIDPTQFSVLDFGDDSPADFDTDIDPTKFIVLE